MALDRRFDLRATERREPSADELVSISREASDLSGKHALLRRGNFAVYVPPSPQEASAEILRTLATRGGNLYAALERHRAVVINPVRPAGSGVLLAGGSFSEVALDVTEAGAVVRKRVRRGETELVDREVRHQQEVEWLAALPPGPAGLFPPVRRVVDTETEVGGDFDFVPAYTFAELVFQERVTGAALAQMLAHVYSTLRGSLYEIPREGGATAGPPVGYVERIR